MADTGGVASLGDIVAVPPVRAARDAGLLKAQPMFHRLIRDGVSWADGASAAADAVIWCTCFRPALSHLAPLDLRGTRGHVATEGTRVVLYVETDTTCYSERGAPGFAGGRCLWVLTTLGGLRWEHGRALRDEAAMAPPKSKVDLYAAIRRDARAGMSYRALMREYGVGFRTVKAALESVWPEPRKKPRPRGTRLDAYKPLIDQMLRADLDAPRKQRHTVKRIFDRLLDEHGAEIRRFITGVVAPHAVLQPKGRWIKHLNTQLSSVESTLDVIADYIDA
jgi:hypothetical protein